MHMNLTWADNANRILVVKIDGRWSWRELEPLMTELFRIDSERSQPFDLIIDARATEMYEPNLADYLRGRHAAPRLAHRRLLIIVGVDEFSQILWRGLTAMPYAAHLKAAFFDTVDEAVVYAAQYTEG
ncbi:MAG: hypothetical protein SF162_10115 [bacterium]|nr:hypothetical protein [bacterium]